MEDHAVCTFRVEEHFIAVQSRIQVTCDVVSLA
jgi:hypothetical protein